MKIVPLAIPDVISIEPDVFGDERGFFFESFNQKAFEEATGLSPSFVQDNHSVSRFGVLRGLHYQLPPYTQGKLVQVVRGAAFDVAVDLRRGADTFGQWIGVILSEETHKQLWVPEGFAHGFLALTDKVEYLYKVTVGYAPDHERCLAWNDPRIGIEWPSNIRPILSEKDNRGQDFDQLECFD